MKNLKCFFTVLCMVFTLAYFHVSASGQSAEDKNRIAFVVAGMSSVRWEVTAPNSGLTVTVSAPDGQVFRKEFKAGDSPEFTLIDKDGNRLPDGQYNYELRLTPVVSAEVKKELAASRIRSDDDDSIERESSEVRKESAKKIAPIRGNGDDDAAVEREMRKRGLLPAQPPVQSGTFWILRGAVITSGAVESSAPQATGKVGMRPRALSAARPFVQSEAFLFQGEGMMIPARAVEATNTRFAHPAFPDVVTADDEIIQGSLCVGLDCVVNESFGFDTIRLKENNTRIKFDDTSTSAGFPANDWQLTANDSASGGASKFSIEDITGAKVPFTITAGAATNSIFVDSIGRLGLRTSTPVLDVHANTSNTPAIRLEQNNSGGFTAQTWDIAGNEANFFVRDITSGSRLPFRIRPGAPTSSIDISASGNVGIGTASPGFKLHVFGAGFVSETIQGDSTSETQLRFLGNTAARISQQASADLIFDTNATEKVRITSGGNVGIGTALPTDTLSVNGTASKPGGGSWSVFSDERLKNIKGHFTRGLEAVMQLQPLRYEYRRNNVLGLNSDGEHIGFGAQAVQKIIPEAVTSNAKGYLLVNNDPILWTMLNAIKEQQTEIEQLKAQIQKLQPRASVGHRPRHLRR